MRVLLITLWFFSVCTLATETHRYLKVGYLEQGWPPYQLANQVRPTGFSVDVITALLNDIDYQPDWYEFNDWAAARKGLCRGDIDILIDAFASSDNQPCISFSKAYHKSPFVVVVNPNSFYFKNINEINESRIVVEKGFLLDDNFNDYYPKAKKIVVSDTVAALNAIKNGEADVYIGNRAVSKHLTDNKKELMIVAQAPLLVNSLHFGVHKNNNLLLDKINQGLSSLSSQDMIALEKKWFRIAYTYMGHSSIFLRPKERAWLKDLPPIRLAWLDGNNPISFIDNNNKPNGAAKDYIDSIKNNLGVYFSYDLYRHKNSNDLFKEGAVDAIFIPKRLIPSLSEWVATDSFFSLPVVIVSRREQKIKGIGDLANKKIIGTDRKLLGDVKIKITSLTYEVSENVELGLESLAAGHADAYIGDIASIANSLRDNPQFDLAITGKTSINNDFVLAIHNRYAPLIPLVNRSIASLEKLEREEIVNRWFPMRSLNEISWIAVLKKLGPFFIATALVIILFTWAYWRLRKLLAYKNKIEIALEKAKEKAENEAQIKAIFLATMSHEIRTPIHGIIGMLEQISMTKLNFEQRQMLAVTSSSASTLYHIVSDVLDYSKIEANKLEIESSPFVLRDLIDHVLLVSGNEVKKKNLSLVLQIEPSLAAIYKGDEYRLQQVMINLVSNAIKFTNEGGLLITLEVVAEHNNKHLLKIGVKDSGIGMSEEQVARIFQPFAQAEKSTTRRFGGTGLGLTISQHLIELMSGEMIVESQKDQGSWVGFQIPLLISAKEKTDPHLHGLSVSVKVQDPILNSSLTSHLLSLGVAVNKSASVVTFSDYKAEAEVYLTPLSGMVGVRRGDGQWLLNSQPITNRSVQLVCYEILGLKDTAVISDYQDAVLPIRILVVEDNDVNRMLMAHQLHQIGLLFDMAENGNDALSYLANQDYALVLCDCHMPYMDGYQLSQQIRLENAIYRDIPIVAMTADVLNAQRSRCLAAGMNDFLSKPIRLHDLRSVLQGWGVVDSHGLDIESLTNAFGDVDILLDILTASVNSLYAGLTMSVDDAERAEWVHKQTGTVALLGLNSLAEEGSDAELILRERFDDGIYFNYRAKLFLVMRQLECAIIQVNNGKPKCSE